jgi:acyl-CoA thioesterase-2
MQLDSHRSRLGHQARATLGSAVVAESSDTIRYDRPGETPLLLWPERDVNLGAAVHAALTETAGLPGLVALDPDRVRIDVVDDMGRSDGRDTTLKRFPTWGDLDDVLDVMNVRPAGPGRFESVTRSERNRPVVEGSQMLGQAVMAAAKLAPGRRVVSAHMVFIRVASTEEPLRFLTEELSSGRTMTTVRVDVVQGDRRCASGTLLLDRTAPDVIRHSPPPPACAGPYDSPPFDMGVTGRDLRVVDGAYDEGPGAPEGDPVIDCWVRFRTLPAEPSVHAALMAQFTGHMSIAAALRPHPGVSQRDAHHSLTTAVNAIALSIHADVRADEWMLYHHLSTFAGDGMTRSEGRVHDAAGALLASFSADCMVRSMGAPTGMSERTAL